MQPLFLSLVQQISRISRNLVVLSNKQPLNLYCLLIKIVKKIIKIVPSRASPSLVIVSRLTWGPIQTNRRGRAARGLRRCQWDTKRRKRSFTCTGKWNLSKDLEFFFAFCLIFRARGTCSIFSFVILCVCKSCGSQRVQGCKLAQAFDCAGIEECVCVCKLAIWPILH